FDGKSVETPTHLRNIVAQTQVGKKTTVKFVRNKAQRTVDVTIVEQPKNMAQAGGDGGDEGGDGVRPSGLLSDLDVRELNSEWARRFGLGGNEKGVVVARVRSGSAAAEAGVKEGDLILEVDRKPTPTLKAYEQAAAKASKSEAVLLLIKRQGLTTYLTLKP
nr:PDZ domain-containing protein [Nitrospirota bacterium]